MTIKFEELMEFASSQPFSLRDILQMKKTWDDIKHKFFIDTHLRTLTRKYKISFYDINKLWIENKQCSMIKLENEFLKRAS